MLDWHICQICYPLEINLLLLLLLKHKPLQTRIRFPGRSNESCPTMVSVLNLIKVDVISKSAGFHP